MKNWARSEKPVASGKCFLFGLAYFSWLLATSSLPQDVFAAGEFDAFTLTGVTARAGGMGNAMIGLSDDTDAIYYNPAGLGNLVQSGVEATYQAPELETSRSFLAANYRWQNPTLPGQRRFWLAAFAQHGYRINEHR